MRVPLMPSFGSSSLLPVADLSLPGRSATRAAVSSGFSIDILRGGGSMTTISAISELLLFALFLRRLFFGLRLIGLFGGIGTTGVGCGCGTG